MRLGLSGSRHKYSRGPLILRTWVSNMARRKKRKKRSSDQKLLKKKPEIFNPLKGDVSPLKKIDKAAENEPDVQIQPEHKKEEDENLDFLEALADVKPLSGSKTKITRLPDPNIKPAHAAGSDELEALATWAQQQ